MSAPSLEQVYTDYHGKVMGYISARIRNRADAEDLCSEVFMKVQRKLEDFDETKASISTWVFTITRNTVIDHFRRSRQTEELDENLSDDTEVDEGLLSQETLSELAGALKRLYDGKPLTEIAKMMGLSYGAVKLRHQNALMLLREGMHVSEDD